MRPPPPATPVVHALHGRVGVGKTTLARRLEREGPALRLSEDEWMLRLYGRDPPAERFADMKARVRERLEALWLAAVRLQVDVVLDFGFWSRAERDRARAICAGVGAEWRLYRVTRDLEHARAAVAARNAAPLIDSLWIAPETFDALQGRLEPLGDDEARVEIVTDG